MVFDFREIIELCAFAWGIYSWSVSQGHKKTLEQRATITGLLEAQSSVFQDKFVDQKFETEKLRVAVNELQKQVATIQAQVEDLKSVTRLTGKMSLESAHLIEMSVGSLQEKLDSFGRVIVRE